MLGLLSLLAPLVVLPTDWSESLPQASAFTSSGYEQIVTTPEVMVYKYKGSSTIRLGAEAKIAVSPQVLHDALVDYEGQVGMIGNLAHVKVLQRGAGWQLAYERIRMPVVSDRDFTVMVTWGKDGRGHWLRYWNDERAGIPKQKGVVRVPYHRGSWQLAPADGGRTTLVRYQVSIDLGGWLPAWMARRHAGKEVPAMFRGFCSLLAKRGRGVDPCLLRLR